MQKPFTRMNAYLASLPNGLDSYPDALANIDVYENHRRRLAQHTERQSLPGPLGDVIFGSPKGWVSDVAGTCLPLLLRDVVFDDDAALMAFTQEGMAQLYSNPLYRTLMRVLSPSLILMGAARRWGTFRRGSSLAAQPLADTPGRRNYELTLTYPPGLYPPLLLDTVTVAFRTSVETGGAKQAAAFIKSHGGTSAVFGLSWAAG